MSPKDAKLLNMRSSGDFAAMKQQNLTFGQLGGRLCGPRSSHDSGSFVGSGAGGPPSNLKLQGGSKKDFFEIPANRPRLNAVNYNPLTNSGKERPTSTRNSSRNKTASGAKKLGLLGATKTSRLRNDQKNLVNKTNPGFSSKIGAGNAHLTDRILTEPTNFESATKPYTTVDQILCATEPNEDVSDGVGEMGLRDDPEDDEMLTDNLSPRNVVQNRPKSKSQRFLFFGLNAFQNKDNNTNAAAKVGKYAEATATAAGSEVITKTKNDLIAPQTAVSKQARNTTGTETIRKPGFLGTGKSSVASTGMTSALKGRKGEQFNSAIYKSTPGPLQTKVQKNPSFLQMPGGKSSTQQLALHKKN